METQTAQKPRIERGREMTRVVVPHEREEVVFAYPPFTDTYIAVGKRILKKGMNLPTGDRIASLLYSAFCDYSVKDEPEFKKINAMMRRLTPFWVFNRNLWIPEGVYVVQDLEAIGTSESLNQNELEKILKGGKELSWGGIRFSKDGRVRFAPEGSYSYPDRFGEYTSKSLAKDGFVIASYGIEGAKKLGEVSKKLRYKPSVCHAIGKDKQEQKVSSLSGAGSTDDVGLVVSGADFDDFLSGRAFGVLK